MLRCRAALLLPMLLLGTGVAAAAAMPEAGAGADRVVIARDGELGGFVPTPRGFALIEPAPGVAPEAHAPGAVVAVRVEPVATPVKKAWLPEPATWVMLIGGMYGIGGVLRRRQRASDAAFTARVRAIAADQDGADRP